MTTNTRRAFLIDPQTRERPGGPVAAMGAKAYNLARLAAIGLPVPHAFVLGTGFSPADDAQDAEAQAELNHVLTSQLRRLERATGLTYGGSRRPLLLSVRSGAAVSMPGTTSTILNVGLNETALRGLLRTTGNPRLTWDSYRRLVQSFAEVVDGCPPQAFDALLDEHLERNRVARPQELDARSLSKLVRESLALYRKLVGKNFPQDPMEQLRAAVQGVYRSWSGVGAGTVLRMNSPADAAGTAVIVQRMAFGNAGGTSGSGVAYTRDPGSGERRLSMDFMFNAQGEDVVSGRHAVVDADQLCGILPTIARKVTDVARALEAEFRDMQEFEFTVQDEVLYILQTRPGQRTMRAELKIAADQVRESLIEAADALARVARVEPDALEHARLAPDTGYAVLCTATSAGAGLAIGSIALDADKARELAARGPVILVRRDATAFDVAGLAHAQGLLTARGGRASHAAVAARELDKVVLVGCSELDVDLATRTCRIGETLLEEGALVCLDGNSGHVIGGRPELTVDRPEADIAEMERWRKLASRTAARGKARAG